MHLLGPSVSLNSASGSGASWRCRLVQCDEHRQGSVWANGGVFRHDSASTNALVHEKCSAHNQDTLSLPWRAQRVALQAASGQQARVPAYLQGCGDGRARGGWLVSVRKWQREPPVGA